VGTTIFEARRWPEAPEFWSYFSVSVEPIQKHVNKCEQRIIPELIGIIVKITSWIIYNHINLSQKETYERKMIQDGSDINAQ